MVTIETEHLMLRDFSEGDIKEYHALRSDPKFQRFYSPELAGEEYSKKLLSLFIKKSQEIPRCCYQLAVTLKSGPLLGSCGIRMESAELASIGCELDVKYHGKGFALEAGRAMLDFAFEILKLKRVYAETNSENYAALRLCKMLGFELLSERIADKEFNGRTWSTSVLSLSTKRWHELKKTGSLKPEYTGIK